MPEARAAQLADPGRIGRRSEKRWSWDIDCSGCDAPMRLLFEVSEWGKMGSPFPDIHTIVELA